MKCPGCGTDGSAVSKTIDSGRYIQRRRRCECGGQWTTNERVEPGSFKVVTGHTRPLVATPAPLVASKHGSPHKSDLDSDLPSCSLSLSDPDQTQTRVEPEDPVVYAGFALSNGETWDLRQSDAAKIERPFPALDCQAQYARAAAWLAVNPTKRKTPKGMPRFLFNWLERAQNSGRGTPANGVPVRPQSRTAGNVDVLKDWLNSKGAA